RGVEGLRAVAEVPPTCDLPVAEREEEPLSPFSKLVMAVERPRLRYLGREDDLALGVKEGKHRLDLRLIPGVHEPRNDLDVLLRHRPRSISPVAIPWHDART